MGRESPRGEEDEEEEEEEPKEEEEGIRWRPPPTFNYNCPSRKTQRILPSVPSIEREP